MKLFLTAFIFLGTLQTQAGDFVCATLKKDDSQTIQQYLQDTCSSSKPFSVTAAKDGASTICCIAKQ